MFRSDRFEVIVLRVRNNYVALSEGFFRVVGSPSNFAHPEKSSVSIPDFKDFKND